jgi:hypothetical protein
VLVTAHTRGSYTPSPPIFSQYPSHLWTTNAPKKYLRHLNFKPHPCFETANNLRVDSITSFLYKRYTSYLLRFRKSRVCVSRGGLGKSALRIPRLASRWPPRNGPSPFEPYIHAVPLIKHIREYDWFISLVALLARSAALHP